MTKTGFDNTVSSLDSKIAENKTKSKSIESELKELIENAGSFLWIFFDGGDGFKPI